MNTISRLVILCTLVAATGCAEKISLEPTVNFEPTKVTPAQVMSPSARFFCEDPILHSSIYTFSEGTLASARASSLYWFNPLDLEQQLFNLKNVLFVGATESTETLLFQASTRNPHGSQPLLQEALFIGTADRLKRTTGAQQLAVLPQVPIQLQRLASIRHVTLRSFGVMESRGILIVPTSTGYTFLKWTGSLLQTLSAPEVKCPPNRCWNPEIRPNAQSEELWFTTFDENTSQFRIQTFSSPFSVAASAPLPLSLSRGEAEQTPLTGPPQLGLGLWLEHSGDTYRLGIRNNHVDQLLELPNFQDLSVLPSESFSELGGRLVVASRDASSEELEILHVDVPNGRISSDFKVPLPAHLRLSQLVMAQENGIYAILQEAPELIGSSALYHWDSSSGWSRLTQNACLNPSWRIK